MPCSAPRSASCKAGRDVLVGVVETHGRSETAELLAGLPQLGLREVAYRGRTLKEFDLDAALARRPEVLLVDELAHSNVEGSRHSKRWQDVQELLEAGIDVWSAVNVQHLESLNGTVGAITGMRVQETVPDTVLDDADEVILVDVTADELTARLKAGKVYLPQQAERAAQNFFRKGNLIALREIALRRTAEHVEDDVRSWRIEQSGASAGGRACRYGTPPAPSWPVSARARGPSRPCEPQLGWPGSSMCAGTLPMSRRRGCSAFRWASATASWPCSKLAEELGAGTAVLAGDDTAAELVAQAQKLNCAILVVGRPHTSRLPGRCGRTHPDTPVGPACADLGHRRSGTCSKRAQPCAERCQRASAEEARGRLARSAGRSYAWAVAASVAITLVVTPLRHAWTSPTSSCCSFWARWAWR